MRIRKALSWTGESHVPDLDPKVVSRRMRSVYSSVPRVSNSLRLRHRDSPNQFQNQEHAILVPAEPLRPCRL
jgi:hypothetical protein